jgi:hypothetical protein
MTGDTATVLIGLALITAVLPLGLLVLYRAERAINLQHPDKPRATPALPRQRPTATAGIPAPATGADDTMTDTRADRRATPSG